MLYYIIHKEQQVGPMPKEELEKYNCYKLVRRNRMTESYRILSEPHKTSKEEWIKVCGGVFGGRVEGNMVYAYID